MDCDRINFEPLNVIEKYGQINLIFKFYIRIWVEVRGIDYDMLPKKLRHF